MVWGPSGILVSSVALAWRGVFPAEVALRYEHICLHVPVRCQERVRSQGRWWLVHSELQTRRLRAVIPEENGKQVAQPRDG